jgi:hypothetical protein
VGVRPVLLAVLLLALAAVPAHAIPWDAPGAIPPSLTPAATTPDRLCGESYANDAPKGGPRLRFGIGPRLAGESGTVNATPLVPENRAKRDRALRQLRGSRVLAVRLNRLFEADGAKGIARFRRMARHYAAMGLEVELQVRYHPTAKQAGDIPAWLRFVRKVVTTFGPIRHVTALQITNEANLTFSPNTSDGAYPKAVDALIQGVIAAKASARRHGYRRLRIGFNYAWRFSPQTDADFWDAIGTRTGKRFRRSLDWVGLDIYPGTFVPPTGIVSYRDAFLEGVAQVRECYMRRARLGRGVPLRIEETGYPTGPGRSEAAQVAAVKGFVGAANAYRGTYGISDFRWFGLRDNNSSGPNFQSYFGLLRSDYTPKPAWATYRGLVRRYGARRR